jgi:tRNA nucleotidyltransferase (CCA-adding enzyme)
MPDERSAGAVIFFENKERIYLLIKYVDGHWGFVKGHVENGEHEKDTVLREAKEEVGLCEKDLSFYLNFRETIKYFYRRDNQTIHKEVVFYLLRSKTTEVSLSHEHTAYCWLSLKDALAVLTYDNAQDILCDAVHHLTQ